jgi:hypothetical protein
LLLSKFAFLILFCEGSLIMKQMMMFGAKTYNDQDFKNLMNSNYYPLENMMESVALLKASNRVDIATMEYGQYQPSCRRWNHGRKEKAILAEGDGPRAHQLECSTQHDAVVRRRAQRRAPDAMWPPRRLHPQVFQLGTADLHEGRYYRAEGRCAKLQ